MEFGKTGSFIYSSREGNTHFLFYCFKHVCHTGGGNRRHTHGGQEGRVCGLGPVSVAAPEETAWCSELVQMGPKAALLLSRNMASGMWILCSSASQT